MWHFFDSAPIGHVILLIAALLVPRSERKQWLAEWKSELWYLISATDPKAHFNLNAARFCLGSWKDALWLRRNSESPGATQRLWLRSPIQCISFLLISAAVTTLIALHESLIQLPYTGRQFMLGQLLVLGVALLMVAANTSLNLGDYPATSHSPSQVARLRRWIFLGIKFAVILPLIFCGTLDLAPIITVKALQPHGTLIGYFLAFRWAIIDQRKRCPVCLRLLTNPVRIGQSSHMIFDWCGTEFMCTSGHGLLHVPERPTISFSTQRWLYLDSSWRSFFVDQNQEHFM